MNTLTLAAVGDVMLGDHPVCFGHGIRSKIRRGEPLIAPELQAMLSGSDMVLGNLECILSDIGHDERRLSSSEMRGDPASIELMKAAGFDTFCVANNHMLQHGVPAFLDTMEWLRKNGIAPVGLYEDGRSNLVTRSKGDTRVAMLGFSLRPEHFCKDNRYYASPTPEAILEQVATLRQTHADHALVVTLHWGEEYLHAPSASQVELAHRLIDSGVALVVGHHPHVVQGVEKYGAGLIAYSLGNFIFDSWQAPTRESLLLRCEFRGNALHSHELVPVKIDRNYHVRLADAAEAAALQKKYAAYSNLVAQRQAPVSLDRDGYAELAGKAYLKYRLQCYWYFLLHVWKYEPSIVGSSFYRSLLRRLGLA